jgi:hypothetical protein
MKTLDSGTVLAQRNAAAFCGSILCISKHFEGQKASLRLVPVAYEKFALRDPGRLATQMVLFDVITRRANFASELWILRE